MFVYDSYRDRGCENKGKFFSRDGRIEDHWVKDNIFARIHPPTLAELDMQVNMQKGD